MKVLKQSLVLIVLLLLAFRLLGFQIHKGATAPRGGRGAGLAPCAEANGDVNGDHQIDISDPISLLDYLYEGGGPPVGFCQPAVPGPYVYSTIYECGVRKDLIGTPQGEADNVAIFTTIIQVHNFHDHEVTFTKHAVLAFPQGQPRGQVSEPVQETLRPGQALAINCENITEFGICSHLDSFCRGFVVIETGEKLDVVTIHRQSMNSEPEPLLASGPTGFIFDYVDYEMDFDTQIEVVQPQQN